MCIKFNYIHINNRYAIFAEICVGAFIIASINHVCVANVSKWLNKIVDHNSNDNNVIINYKHTNILKRTYIDFLLSIISWNS